MDDCVERGLLGGFEHGLEGGVLEHGLIGLASELVVDGVGRLCGGCRNVEPRRFCPWPRDPNNGIVAGADNKAAPDEWKSNQNDSEKHDGCRTIIASLSPSLSRTM